MTYVYDFLKTEPNIVVMVLVKTVEGVSVSRKSQTDFGSTLTFLASRFNRA